MRAGRIKSFLSRLENSLLIRSIRGGLVMLIPVLMVGAFALILTSLPITVYQNFITGFANGLLLSVFTFVYRATFGMLSLYMTICIGYSMAKNSNRPNKNTIGTSVASVCSFLISVGFLSEEFDNASFAAAGMFVAILCAIVSSAIFLFMDKRMNGFRVFSDGSDPAFNRALSTIVPLTVVAVLFASISFLINEFTSSANLWQLISNILCSVFDNTGGGFWGGFLYVLIPSTLWFFGIHGSDVLENVNVNVFLPAAEANAAAAAAGAQPVNIYTKTFFDVFVLMGGCGTLLCLLIALLIFSKRKSNRSIAKIAAFPMFFNINEIMVFGLPIIYNPIMLIPFIMTPISSFLIASAATSLGLVPMTTNSVEWTTPIILGGYLSTGSVAGAVLQVVNLTVGVLIYAPFVKLYDKLKERQSLREIHILVDIFKEHEQSGNEVVLSELGGNSGDLARQLINDLRVAINDNSLDMSYQPQYNFDGTLIGSEALLRWNHPLFGAIYAPLVIRLASESNQLLDLENCIILRVKSDAEKGIKKEISINATASSLMDDRFIDFIINTFPEAKAGEAPLCIEVTEQSKLDTDEGMLRRLMKLREHNFRMAIDDFSMGYTSLKYLQDIHFDLVKLDGSLTKGLMSDKNTEEIIASIVYLSKSINFDVLAEFVETEEQKQCLAKLGCMQYQGYLFSKAVSLEQLIEIEKEQRENGSA